MSNPFDPFAPAEAGPPAQGGGALSADPFRGLPVQPIVPASPLDLFTRKPLTAPDVSQGSGRGVSQQPEPPRLPGLIPVDQAANQQATQADEGLQDLMKNLGGGAAKQPSAEEILNRVKIAAAEREAAASATATKKPESSMPAISGDRADYYRNTGGFESGDNDKAVNPFYSPDKAAAGRFQFMPTTVASMRAQNPDLAKEIDANWRTDKRQQLLLMNAYTDISDNLIKQITGRDPDNAQRFALHLFGHGTGAKIIKNPDLNIEAFFTPEQFKEVVRVNPGVITYGMTGNDFLKWAGPIFGKKHDK